MTADAEGNDILAVGVPVTGFIGLAPFGTPFPTPEEGSEEDLELDPAFVKLGLLKDDGGPQFAWGSTGDALEFWQDGYTIPSGLADVSITVTAAEALSDQVREIVSGETVDGFGYDEVDGGGHSERYVAFTEEIFANGAIRRRVAPNVGLKSTTEDKSTRGVINGQVLVFEVSRSTELEGTNKHFGQWVLPAVSGS